MPVPQSTMFVDGRRVSLFEPLIVVWLEALAGEAGDADELADAHVCSCCPVKTKMPSDVAVLPSPVGSWM